MSLLASLPAKKRQKLLENLSDEEALALKYCWEIWARPEQLPPDGDWFVWLALAGRGWGKTRTGAHWIHNRAMAGDSSRWMALISKTPADARDDMIQGLGGILKNVPPWEKPIYTVSNRSLTWSTGARATVYSGANPNQIRGFSGDTAWCDELAFWDYPRDSWSNLLYGMREAKVSDPQILVTTTPLPLSLLKEIRDSEWTVRTGGSSYDNRENLSDIFYRAVIEPREGTSLGRQEIWAELLDEMPGALWTRKLLEENREEEPPELRRIVISVDPAVTSTEDSNETGITIGGINESGEQGWLLEDVSGRYTPKQWAQKVINRYYSYKADRVVAEKNNGGDLVASNIHTMDPNIPVKLVHAAKGKYTRAEPVSSMYEQNRIHHVKRYKGARRDFAILEDQMCTWIPGDDSPDRLDSNVWLWTELMLGKKYHDPRNLSFTGDKKTPAYGINA